MPTPQHKYLEKMADAFGPAAEAKRYRESAEYYEGLASAARSDGDHLDGALMSAKAAEMRKKARLAEARIGA